MYEEYEPMLTGLRFLASVREAARNLGRCWPFAFSPREEACPPRASSSCREIRGLAMDADRDGQAEAQHHVTRTAAAQCYVDFLLGRVLPVQGDRVNGR